MKPVSKISSGQLVMLLLAGRLSNCLLFSSDSFRQFTLMDCVLSMLLNGVLVLLLLLPTVLVLRKGTNGTTDTAYALSKPFGAGLTAAYLLLCLFVLGIDIVQFSDFVSKTMKGNFSVFLLTVVFIAACLIAAFYGIQALARASLVVAVFSAVCLIVFTVVLLPEMESIHFPPATGGRWGRVLEKAIADLPRTVEVVAIGLVYPYVKGPALKSCFGFAGATAFFSALAAVTAIGVLGDFSSLTVYPYYAAVTAAQIGVFQRLDILVTAVWLGTFFVRFTLFCMLLQGCARRLFGPKAGLPTGLVTFGVLLITAFWIQSGSYHGEWQWITQIYWWVLGAFCLLLPLLLWALCRRRKRV